MQQNKITYLAEALEQLPTGQLDDMLNKELESENPNATNVRLILKELHKREENENTPLKPETETAWAEYLMVTNRHEPERKGKPVVKIAMIVIVTTLLLAIMPQEASARNFFHRLVEWTDSILALVSEEDSVSVRREYVFTTDNPGLQQVYDAVVELGITKPVVPMWLPEGYELIECKVDETPKKDTVSATFSDGEERISLRINIYSDNISSKYYKNDKVSKSIEMSGIDHMITQNENKLVAVWIQENIESSISADCREDDLIKILKSIYIMEDE